ncbi:hypothetical protein L211DRAFT_834405, partial [Terfezia boudieri ATCC MYA-4762]
MARPLRLALYWSSVRCTILLVLGILPIRPGRRNLNKPRTYRRVFYFLTSNHGTYTSAMHGPYVHVLGSHRFSNRVERRSASVPKPGSWTQVTCTCKLL